MSRICEKKILKKKHSDHNSSCTTEEKITTGIWDGLVYKLAFSGSIVMELITLKLHADKTQVMWVTTRQQLRKIVDAEIILKGHIIAPSTSVMCLWTHNDPELTFAFHVENTSPRSIVSFVQRYTSLQSSWQRITEAPLV